MCRLLAYRCAEPRSVADLLGDERLERFVGLSRLHRDGWGMGWVSEEGELRVTRSTERAGEDAEFARLVHEPLGRIGFVHLRWATSGLAIQATNTHPFVADGWAFVHQGSIKPPEQLDSLLSPEWQKRRRGTTDSERYFFYLLQNLAEEAELTEAVSTATTLITEVCGPASLNAVLLSVDELVVVHGLDDLEPPAEELLAALGGDPASVPPEHLEDYFSLRYRYLDGDLAVISSGLAENGWARLSPLSYVRAPRFGTVTSGTLGGGGQSGPPVERSLLDPH